MAGEEGCIPMGTVGQGVEVSGDRPHQGRLPRGGGVSAGL